MEVNNSKHKQLISKDTTLTFRGIAAVMVILSHYAEWYSWFLPTEGRAEIFRVSLTKLGVYGVDIFFLLSGYAMVKSLGDKKVNLDFISKRIKNVYLPYFIVTGVIELISGGFTSLRDFWMFASGYDYWYMNILFIFYIAFFIIYAIIKNKPVRIGFFCVFTYIYSYILYTQGRYEFWFVSNITFVIGIMIAECENFYSYKKSLRQEKFKHKSTNDISANTGNATGNKITYIIYLFLIVILSIGMFFIIKSGLYGQEVISRLSTEQQIWLKIGATLVWTLLVLMIAVRWRIMEKLFSLLGKNSLYLYLTHTYIFMRCANSQILANIALDENTALMLKFAISAVVTVIVSILCNLIISKFIKAISDLHDKLRHEA